MTEAAAVRKTFFNRVALPVISWGLPFHSLIIAMLFGGLGLALGTVRTLAAWKEAFVLGLILLVILRAATGRGPRVAVHWIDLAVLTLIGIAAVFMGAGHAFFQIDLPPGAEAYGIRDIAFFLLLYFVGRASPEIADDPNTLRRLYIIVLLTSAIAVVEWILVTPDMLVLLGVASYFQDFLNVSAFTTGNEFGLPTNYWSRIGSVDVQRAGSIYLSSQGFAMPFLILLPVATAYVFGRAKRVTTSTKIEYAIVWMGLLLSITRMTIFVCMIQLVFVVIMLRKPEWAVAGLIVTGSALLVAIFTVPDLGGFFWDTLTGQTGSNASHSKDVAKGVAAFLEHPFGAGLGTTDQTAIRVGLTPLTADNGYLKYAVELGIEGLIAHLLIFAGILVTSFKVARNALTLNRRLLGTVVFFTTIGVMMNAMTGVVFNTPVLSYLYFWFAGSVVSISQMERAPRAVRQPEQRLELSAA
ncbi:MAG TPA: O-antigen ligase family protein [Gemmatimonadaceae bacterium]|nr:O-antigen ligase family protein [Gemmatimonadaceae bacterium]